MREIKFRAWNKIDECFFKWDLSFAFGGTGKIWGNVEQYTGLKDKNGVEIYEGDIVKDKDIITYVDWSLMFASFVLIKDGWAFSHFFGEASNPSDCEVIGNIHQSPELLK